jgi:hypothetical protein
MGTSIWTGNLSSDWANADNWSTAEVPGAGSNVVISLGAAVASASIGTVNSITNTYGLDFESAGTNTVTTFVDNTRSLSVDGFGGEGGTTLNIGGTLTNSGALLIGNSALSSPSKVSATALTNTGRIFLIGSSTNQAVLDVSGVAGIGTAGVWSGTVSLAGESAIQFASGQITSLAANAQLHLNGSNAFIEDSAALGSNSALTGLASIGAGATFGILNGAAVSTGALVNDGSIGLDITTGAGGSSLTLAGALTNSGSLRIGNATLSASDKVTAASLDNTGKILLHGSGANQALLDVTSSAGFGTAGVLSGYVRVAYNSAIEFKSGQITSLAAGAHLGLHGKHAFIEDSTALGSNSALKELASIGSGATFKLHNGASVSTTGGLVNDGNVELDTNAGNGGSSLTVGGTLTNSQNLTIGNTTLSASDKVTTESLDNTGSVNLTGFGADQALLDVTGSAGFGTAGVLTGHVQLAGGSAIEFKGGEITSLAASASLLLDGTRAFLEDSTPPGSNSALTGLASIGGGATFDLENGASVSTGALVNDGNVDLGNGASMSTTGALVNDGTINLDTNGGAGGSSLTLAGALTNTGTLNTGNSSLSSPSKVSATALANTGSINLTGSRADQALLDVTAGSAGFGTDGTLSGNVQLSGDSAIEFASGHITSLAANAQLLLNGSDAFIEDSSAPGSNSALAGLASIGGGATFDLENGPSVSTTGSLANDGNIQIDRNSRDGGSSLTVAGALTNSGNLTLDSYYSAGGSTLSIGGALTNTGQLIIGGNGLSAPVKATTASIDNSGSITVFGSGTNQALLDVTTGVAGFGTAGTATGTVLLENDAAIEFVRGQISTIAASSQLDLQGPNAFIEDSTALPSNSALHGLSNILGAFTLINGASVSTTGALTNSGSVSLEGTGSTLSIAGALTNNGAFSIANDTETLAGAVGGRLGSFSLSNAHLQFDSSVSAHQTINESGAAALILEHAQTFAATISGFGTGDTIDAANFLFSGTTLHFTENVARTGCILTLNDGSLTANILLAGSYIHSDFKLAPDHGTGTLVKFV